MKLCPFQSPFAHIRKCGPISKTDRDEFTLVGSVLGIQIDGGI